MGFTICTGYVLAKHQQGSGSVGSMKGQAADAVLVDRQMAHEKAAISRVILFAIYDLAAYFVWKFYDPMFMFSARRSPPRPMRARHVPRWLISRLSRALCWRNGHAF
jgi:hypothetical protein